MRKKILYFVAIATIVIFGACSNEDLMPETERTFTFAASIDDDSPTTRVLLEKDGKNIVLKWEYTDVLEIVMVQDGVKVKSTATVNSGSITSDGKRAIFNASWKTIDKTRKFDFYGVYGGSLPLGENLPENTTNVILPTNAGNATSLTDVQNRKDVMLYFASPDVVADDLDGGVTFKHLGSLFSITLKNNCTSDLDLQKASLVGTTSGNEDWAYNSGAGGKVFDLVTETFNTTGTNGNSISFSTDVTSLPANGGVMTFVAWYPLLPINSWPELQLVLDDQASTPLSVRKSENRKPARPTSTPAITGKNYHFYAVFDGTNLNFTNAALDPVPIP